MQESSGLQTLAHRTAGRALGSPSCVPAAPCSRSASVFGQRSVPLSRRTDTMRCLLAGVGSVFWSVRWISELCTDSQRRRVLRFLLLLIFHAAFHGVFNPSTHFSPLHCAPYSQHHLLTPLPSLRLPFRHEHRDLESSFQKLCSVALVSVLWGPHTLPTAGPLESCASVTSRVNSRACFF